MKKLTFTRFTKFEEIPENLLPGVIAIRLEADEEYQYPLEVKTSDYESQIRSLKTPLPSDIARISLIAHIGDHVVGLGSTRLNIGEQNRKNCSVYVNVLTEERKKGYGRSILKEIVKEIPGEVETIFFNVFPINERFSTHIEKKYPVKLGMVTRKSASDLRKFQLDSVRSRCKELRQQASDFEFVIIRDCEFPENFDLDKYAEVLAEIWNDMPREDLDFEDEKITAKYFEEIREQLEIEQSHNWLIVAVHKESGEYAGVTDIYVDFKFPDVIYQGDTGVISRFRGNKLGLTLKYMMLEQILSSPELSMPKYITTHNAQSNEHMIAINNELLYEEVAMINEYEIKKLDLLNLLS